MLKMPWEPGTILYAQKFEYKGTIKEVDDGKVVGYCFAFRLFSDWGNWLNLCLHESQAANRDTLAAARATSVSNGGLGGLRVDGEVCDVCHGYIFKFMI